jgi:hypothetical protein
LAAWSQFPFSRLTRFPIPAEFPTLVDDDRLGLAAAYRLHNQISGNLPTSYDLAELPTLSS